MCDRPISVPGRVVGYLHDSSLWGKRGEGGGPGGQDVYASFERTEPRKSGRGRSWRVSLSDEGLNVLWEMVESMAESAIDNASDRTLESADRLAALHDRDAARVVLGRIESEQARRRQ